VRSEPFRLGSYRSEIDTIASLSQLSTTFSSFVPAPDQSGVEQVAPNTMDQRLEPLVSALRDLAEVHQDNPEGLLLLLRELESLHREIQDGPFRSSLPENRHKLFTLLQTMEKSGGWPYIPRLQLRTFIGLLDQDSSQVAA
jgi:hypothetical protein